MAVLFLSTCGEGRHPDEATTRWCDRLPRPGFRSLERVTVPDDWFEVYRVGDGVVAIYEPWQFQEVISYLILGSERALLFDTGMGISSISAVVRALTPLPVTVLNSHTHYDHVGGNAEFDQIASLDTEFTRNSARGIPHEVVQGEVAADAFCRPPPVGFDTAAYQIRPFAASQLIGDGHRIDLGGRTLEVLAVPGHTPDAIAVLDSAAGYLWTGDSFYEAPIWLWFPETDLDAFEASVHRMALLAPRLTRLFPAHNGAVAAPAQLLELERALAEVRSGRARGERAQDSLLEFSFPGFSILTSRAILDRQSR
jgi:glyoxylase-like metal-dependent hydrolase (beta-lactamase superfamily II)